MTLLLISGVAGYDAPVRVGHAAAEKTPMWAYPASLYALQAKAQSLKIHNYRRNLRRNH